METDFENGIIKILDDNEENVDTFDEEINSDRTCNIMDYFSLNYHHLFLTCPITAISFRSSC